MVFSIFIFIFTEGGEHQSFIKNPLVHAYDKHFEVSSITMMYISADDNLCGRYLARVNLVEVRAVCDEGTSTPMHSPRRPRARGG